MKRHYWQFLIDSAGNALSGVKINVYLANSNNYAHIFATENGSNTTTEFTDIITDDNGMFDFWLADLTTSPIYGYPHTQRFRITWSKAGYLTGEIDNIDIIYLAEESGKIKIDSEDDGEYLSDKLLAGDNITIEPSAGKLLISSSGGSVYDNIIAGNNLTVETSGSNIITSYVGHDLNFTYENIICPGSSAETEFNLDNFMNRGLVHYFKVEEVSGGATAEYDVEMYAEAAMTTLLYQATGIDPSSAWIDALPFWVKDLDLTNKLHIKFINTDSLSMVFNITILGEGFA